MFLAFLALVIVGIERACGAIFTFCLIFEGRGDELLARRALCACHEHNARRNQRNGKGYAYSRKSCDSVVMLHARVGAVEAIVPSSPGLLSVPSLVVVGVAVVTRLHVKSLVRVPGVSIATPGGQSEYSTQTTSSCSTLVFVGASERKVPVLQGAHVVSVVAVPVAFVHSPALHILS